MCISNSQKRKYQELKMVFGENLDIFNLNLENLKTSNRKTYECFEDKLDDLKAWSRILETQTLTEFEASKMIESFEMHLKFLINFDSSSQNQLEDADIAIPYCGKAISWMAC